jgi:hypothetical protein
MSDNKDENSVKETSPNENSQEDQPKNMTIEDLTNLLKMFPSGSRDGALEMRGRPARR